MNSMTGTREIEEAVKIVQSVEKNAALVFNEKAVGFNLSTFDSIRPLVFLETINDAQVSKLHIHSC